MHNLRTHGAHPLDLLRTYSADYPRAAASAVSHTVVSAEGFAQAFKACKDGRPFDLLILGHSIPHDDKMEMISEARKTCSCPILALLRLGETPLPDIERSIDSWEPQAFMKAVGEMLGSQLVKRDRD